MGATNLSSSEANYLSIEELIMSFRRNHTVCLIKKSTSSERPGGSRHACRVKLVSKANIIRLEKKRSQTTETPPKIKRLARNP
jgi:hypothetical protein